MSYKSKSVFPCTQCDFEAQSARQLSRHKAVTHTQNALKCPLCPFVTVCQTPFPIFVRWISFLISCHAPSPSPPLLFVCSLFSCLTLFCHPCNRLTRLICFVIAKMCMVFVAQKVRHDRNIEFFFRLLCFFRYLAVCCSLSFSLSSSLHLFVLSHCPSLFLVHSFSIGSLHQSTSTTNKSTQWTDICSLPNFHCFQIVCLFRFFILCLLFVFRLKY